MSRNSKNSRNIKIAKEISATRKAKGPDAPKQNPGRKANATKRKAWWQIYKSYAEYIKGGGKKVRRDSSANDEPNELVPA